MAGTLRSACNSGTGAEATPSTAAIARWRSATPLHRAFLPCALPIHILRTCKCHGIQPIGSLVGPTRPDKVAIAARSFRFNLNARALVPSDNRVGSLAGVNSHWFVPVMRLYRSDFLAY